MINAYTQGVVHGEQDRLLSLLRLEFQNRDKALALIEKKIAKPDEYVNAVRYALGAKNVKIGKTPHYWIAAAQCRAPYEDDAKAEKAFPGYGPDTGLTAKYDIGKVRFSQIGLTYSPAIPPEIDMAFFPTVALHEPVKAHCMDLRQEHPWKLIVWPQNLDPVICAAIDIQAYDYDSPYETGFDVYLAALQRDDVAIRDVGTVAIFLALVLKKPTFVNAATDAAIVTIGDGRLSIELAITMLRKLIKEGNFILTRWLKPLKIIAEQSDIHAAFVRQIIEGIVPTLDNKTVGGFLELLYELCIADNVAIESNECHTYLVSLKGTGKAVNLAKKLLEM